METDTRTPAQPITARKKTRGRMQEYLKHPLLAKLNAELKECVRKHGAMKSITLNITKNCNLRCEGCYFFGKGLDVFSDIEGPEALEAFIRREKARGTNTVTVAGGEPSLVLDRVKRLYEEFHIFCVTNGLKRVPYEGFEKMSLAVSVWGDHEHDTKIRGNGKREVFAKALEHYRDDPRVHYFFTVGASNAYQIESVVEEVVRHGNRIFFNYYGYGDHANGTVDFSEVRAEIDRMIDKYPNHVLMTSYLNRVGAEHKLYGERWGYDVCPNISPVHPLNADRVSNGKAYNTHFRPFNTDLVTTSRCCMGEEISCGTCNNIWPITTWVMINARKHMGSLEECGYWLASTYVVHLQAS